MATTDIRLRARRLGAAVLLASVACLLSAAPSHADPLLAAAGDIACPAPPTTSSECQQASTAAEIQLAGPTAVAALGDDQYDSGTLTEFNSTGAYHQTWGQFDSLVHPVPGNHEYSTPGAADYFTYFGTAAGPNSRGYYSYDLAGWHLIALNSNCTDGASPPCDNNESGAVTAAEMSWLKADLAAHPGVCTLAYWHHPQFTSGSLSIRSPSPGGVTPLWQALYAAHADVVLNGHNHAYERFAQQDPSGAPTSAGIREFVVGTGGRSLSGAAGALIPNDQVYDATHFGVLFLTLHPTSYEWQFRAISGTVVDRSSGAVPCHAGASITSPADGSYSRSHDVPVAGTAEPGSTVTVSEGSASRATTTAGSDGRWSTTMTALADGSHTLSAVATDPANPTGPVSNQVRVIVDTTPPAAPSISSPPDGSSLGSHDVSIFGTAEPNSTVSVADAGARQASVIASPGGGWSTLLHNVADGRHVYTAAATDAAGNTGPSSPPVRVAVNTLALDHVSITHPRFAPGRGRRGVPHGTAFRFTLSEVASVRIVLLARRPGRRSGHGCVSVTRKLRRHHKSCIRLVVVGSLWLPRRGPGTNDAGFDGRLAGHVLPSGSYMARIQATGPGGLSPARTVRFMILGR